MQAQAGGGGGGGVNGYFPHVIMGGLLFIHVCL